jgi:hypothetical protein
MIAAHSKTLGAMLQDPRATTDAGLTDQLGRLVTRVAAPRLTGDARTAGRSRRLPKRRSVCSTVDFE